MKIEFMQDCVSKANYKAYPHVICSMWESDYKVLLLASSKQIETASSDFQLPHFPFSMKQHPALTSCCF